MVIGYWLLVLSYWFLVTGYWLTPLWGWGLSVLCLVFLLLIWLFRRNTEGVRVLMYHKFSTSETDFLTVTTTQFEEQLNYLQTNDYQFITMQQLLDFYTKNKPLPRRSVLLTFDDAYVSQLELAYPVLKKYSAKATVFVPTAYVGQGSNWDTHPAPIMSLEQLQNLDPSVFSLALHTHTHPNFKTLKRSEIKNDIDACLQYFTTHNLPFFPVLAYAYGARPKNAAILRGMKKDFQNSNILAAFRIGNRVNSLKVKDLYELNRIDIRGTDSWTEIKKKIIYGKRMFS
jgi:peptidoglycan/xylan/chitin deacetylase (PgdA/CDA1 family)